MRGLLDEQLSERMRLRGDPLAVATDHRQLYVTLNTDGLLVRVDPAMLPAERPHGLSAAAPIAERRAAVWR